MKRYDLAFSLGRACSCTETLRKAGLQHLSFPWDWIAGNGSDSDILCRTEIVRNGFRDWLRLEDLVPDSRPGGPGKDRYRNTRTGYSYNHDFPKGVPLESSYPEVKAKYDRRIARFLKLLGTAKSVLIACIDMPLQKTPTSIEDCRKARAAFAEMFPNARFDFVLFSRDPGRSLADCREDQLDDGFTRLSFDYRSKRPGCADHEIDLGATASLLRARFEVADYRTKEEIAALRERTRKAKMREAGVENAWQYFLAKRRRALERLTARLSPRMLVARLRTKRYDHVLSLGSNCDAGFRFCQKWGFVDSTPFTWGQTLDIGHVVQALRHPESIGADGFSWHAPSAMWRCNRTGMYFHGRMKATQDRPEPDEAALKADLEELKSRLGHLKEKLLSVLADGSSKALILRVNSKEASADGINGRLDELQGALAEVGARNHLLVVVAERKVKGLIRTAPGRVVRYVRQFNPQSAVTDAKLGDPVGWDAIFTEFAPAVVKKATHRFKFE
jgi:hypothetical protein